MQAVGRIGSYITRSVYNVSGTFHPFGGCVDIIVVEQPDGSFKSSPWYVRFGKFQGVLKSKEKVVTISVNDVNADFHMYLDNRGEAYFLKEVDVEEGESFISPPTSSGEEMDGQPENEWRLKSKNCSYDSSLSDSVGAEKRSVDGNSVVRYQRLGLIFGRKRSMERIRGEEKSRDVYRTDSLERAEIAANLLDLKWSTNLDSSPSKKDNVSRLSSVKKVEFSDSLNNGCCDPSETDGITNTGYLRAETTFEGTIVEVKCLDSNCEPDSVMPVEGDREGTKSDSQESSSDKLSLVESECQLFSANKILEVKESHFRIEGSEENLILSKACFSEEDGAKDNLQYSGEASEINLQNTTDEISCKHAEEPLNSEMLFDKGDQLSFICEEKVCMSEETVDGASEISVTEHYSEELVPIHQSSDSFKDNASENFMTSSKTFLGETVEYTSHSCPSLLENTSLYELFPHGNQESRISEQEQSRSCNSDGFGTACVIDSELKYADYGGEEVDATSNQSVLDEFMNDEQQEIRRLRSVSNDSSDLGSGITSEENSDQLSSASQTVTEEDKIPDQEGPLNLSSGFPENSSNDVSSFRGSAKRSFSFSFKRSRSKNISQMETITSGNDNSMESRNGPGALESRKDRSKADIRKRLVRTLIPTSEQLASLKLEQGKNLVTFTFSTAMLGKQQVDARIFLWRWDTRIVISDVDGTITRSDLLGQVMPLVGMDWSQSGVAHLFSAIKENGYQLLFLSARSIAQSFHTRQFLFNIKQDGKALPEGPVVISPDGLFPSLFREVIRRAPHEFKIACLEDIRALFPADSNPFYAGFGNRDTDEFSYVKVGIPKGKIFIINPKGEIVVNRRVDTKSYVSLHSLVHGMFPTMSSFEQEDFNSWNYWKLPPPLID